MKVRPTIKSLLFAVAALGAMAAQNASASTYGFENITNNNPSNIDVASQLSVDVLAVGTTKASFTFHNNVGIKSSIMGIYFDDINPPASPLLGSMAFSATSSSSGVLFDNDANGKAPGVGDLPGGNQPWVSFTANYAGDSVATKKPNVSQVQNGVNASNEWVTFLGTFASGKDFNGLIAALNNGTFRIGLHVQSIGTAGKSDSFVNVSAVPLPAAAWLFGSALFGFMMVSNRRKV